MIKGAETEKTKSGQIIPVEALVIQPQRITQNIPLTGILQPNHQVDIVAEVSGKVTQINKRLGEPVTIKDTLAVIDDKIPLSNYRQARSQVLSAENNLKIAKLNLKSDKELFNNGDISQLAYENSQLAVKSAEASRLSALANLSLLEKNYRDTRITSPINGLISRKNIDMGMMVTPGTPLYRVVDLTTLKIKVGVPQSMISHISTGSSAEVEISALNNQVFKGNVHHISPQADENTGAFELVQYAQGHQLVFECGNQLVADFRHLAAALVGAFLKMIGGMGLPLALLSIGAALKWTQAKSHLGALGWVVGCKLLLLPLVTLALIRLFCPGVPMVSLGAPVILASAPNAVAMYVISCQVGIERGFVSSMLLLSTVLSVVTIPIWVYIVKGLGG